MRRFSFAYISILVGVVLWLPVSLCAEETTSREYKIKAAYLYNLIKFVNWPSGRQLEMNTAGQTSICILGHNPFSTHLEKLTSRKAKGRDIIIKYILPQDTPEQCNIVFISEHNKNSRQLLSNSLLVGAATLTVGENSNFVNSGGIVSLIVQNNNVQLQINLAEAKKTGFQISGNLLEIAEVIQ